MALKCQEDSYVQVFITKLEELVQDKFMVSTGPGSQKEVHGMGVILQNTILFPEGGGQPSDEGILKIEKEGGNVLEVRVSHVFKRDSKVVHLVEDRWDVAWSELRPGAAVHQTLCWPRRKYHMMQHSGQHLISALAEKLFKLETLSWCLGPDSSVIELSQEQITMEQYKTLETEANRLIGLNLRVTAHLYEAGDPALQEARTRGLPKDHVGPYVRVIEIEGVDKNMCCGTHVSSLNQLEVIKFLRMQKKVFKKKTTCLLYFLVGKDYVFKLFDGMQEREDSISSILNKPPQQHVATITKMKESLANSNKKVKDLEKEITLMLVNAFKEKSPTPAFFVLHRSCGDMELMSFVSRQFREWTDIVLFLTVGEEEEGHFLFEAPVDLVADLALKLADLLQGRGKLIGNRYQSKVSKLSERKKAEAIIRDALPSSCLEQST